LTDSDRFDLRTVLAEDMGTQSECTGACASAWLPLRRTGKPTVGGGANASLVGTTMRSDGSPQVTYAGHPLYLFSGDQNPGDTNGEGLVAYGASWYAVSPAGNQITGQASSSGVGYGYQATRAVSRSMAGRESAVLRHMCIRCAVARRPELIASLLAVIRCGAKLVLLAIGIVTSEFDGGR